MNDNLNAENINYPNYWNWNGFKTCWSVIGEDNEIPIIFLHGFGASRKHWRNNLEYFAKRNCASYSLDLIGFGDSDQPGIKQIEKLNNEIWCNQVRDFIDQVIRPKNPKKVVLIGNSLGSLVALTCAVSLEHQIATVIASPLPDQIHKVKKRITNKTLFKISSNTKRIGAKYKLLPDHIFTQKDGTIRGKWSKSSRDKKTHEMFLKKVCIIDRNEKWLEQWKHQFHMLEIPNLRSALGAHCDPIDPQCMRIFIEGNGDRDSSVINLKLDRSVAYHGPYEVPKTHIYNKFSDTIVERYHLENS